MPLLDNKTVLITGASSGIGLATARLLADDGASVVLVGRRQSALDEAVAGIRAAGGTATAYAADVTVREEVLALVPATRERFGPVDVLVNCAGSANAFPNILWTPPEDWAAVIATNLDAVYSLVQATLPDMLERGAGTIITVSSLAAANPNLLGGAAYGAAKAGVRNLMQFLHTTYRNEGIRASTILPGEVSTPIMDTRVQPPSESERAAMAQPEDVAQAIRLVATLPQRATIPELVIAPTRQRDISADLLVSRDKGKRG